MIIYLEILKNHLGGCDIDKDGVRYNIPPIPKLHTIIRYNYPIASTLISDAFRLSTPLPPNGTSLERDVYVLNNNSFENTYIHLQKSLSEPKKIYGMGLNDSFVKFHDYNCYFEDYFDTNKEKIEIISIKAFQYILKRWEEELTKFNKDKDTYTSPLVEQIEWDENDPLKEPKVTIIRNTT